MAVIRSQEHGLFAVRLSPRLRRAWSSGIPWATLACLALAVGMRLVIVLRAPTMMNGDEAVLGIQAEQILRGARPVYFAGQPYMGAWDAYLLAPLVAVFGPSAWIIRAVTLTESLLLVPLLGALAVRLYGERTRLPAMLLAAIPPVYVAIGELRMSTSPSASCACWAGTSRRWCWGRRCCCVWLRWSRAGERDVRRGGSGHCWASSLAWASGSIH